MKIKVNEVDVDRGWRGPGCELLLNDFAAESLNLNQDTKVVFMYLPTCFSILASEFTDRFYVSNNAGEEYRSIYI